MLWSLSWTDRNKSSIALWQLTANRDSAVLAEVRARALRPLIDVARWTDAGHAIPGVVLLCRIEGRRDQEIFAATQRGDRSAILEEADHMLKAAGDARAGSTNGAACRRHRPGHDASGW
jgi:hypothetical protein